MDRDTKVILQRNIFWFRILNRLAHSSSPYLRQHAHNPVDWYPWGDEALTRAKELDRPLFISIGYATCHWCHVMERESFESEDVAALLNASTIPIKIDREEYPDVDHFYMSASVAAGRRGGWPLTILALPDGKPFYSATYLPRLSSGGRLGLLELLEKITNLWNSDRAPAIEAANDLVQVLDAQPQVITEQNQDLQERALAAFRDSFDAVYGGFGGAPKFPSFHNMRFLMRMALRTGDKAPLSWSTRTLLMARSGGIWDHVGHGFHRYATDARWHLPHFEKMLYDQAMALATYAEAWSLTGEPLFLRTCNDLFDVLRRDFMTEDGLFYSAWDADSEGEEGRFHLWHCDELRDFLSGDELQLLEKHFGILPAGNTVDEASGQPTGRNILDAIGGHEPVDLATLDRFEPIRKRLLERREGRIHPLRDDKVLLDWNAMTVAAMALASRKCSQPDMLQVAEAAGERLLEVFTSEDGTLLRRRFDGETGIRAQLDDIANLAWAYLELFQATGRARWMERCLSLAQTLIEHFWSEERQAFFISDGDRLPLRQTRMHDEAYPSGSAVALTVLSALASITAQSRYDDILSAAFQGIQPQASRWPQGFSGSLCAAPRATRGEIVVTGKEFLPLIDQAFLPDHVVIRLLSEEHQALVSLMPHITHISPEEGPSASVCTGQVCSLPVRHVDKLKELLSQIEVP